MKAALLYALRGRVAVAWPCAMCHAPELQGCGHLAGPCTHALRSPSESNKLAAAGELPEAVGPVGAIQEGGGQVPSEAAD